VTMGRPARITRVRAPDARIMKSAERDGARLAAQGYRVVSSDWYELPLFGFHFMRVTYEANEDHRA
jgi:hypothetical protein